MSVPSENPLHESDRPYEALLEDAREAIRGKQLARADSLARTALSHAPNRAAAYNVLAAVRELQGDHRDAMDLLRAAVAVDPTYQLARDNLVRLTSGPHHGPMLLGDEDA